MKVDLGKYRNSKVCVAVSGGSDSMCLLHLFATLRDDYGILLSAVNVEHGIRGDNSVADSVFVREQCAILSVPLTCFSGNCTKLAQETGVSLESAARAFRYECFEKVAKSVDYIATAHNLGDNAETILFHIARGSSLSGVKGIRDRGKYVRPLIGVSKTDILEYIRKYNIPYVEDETNASLDYTRNKLRHSVLPALETAVNGASANLCEFAKTAAEDDEFIFSIAKDYVINEGGKVSVKFTDKKPVFSRAVVLALRECGVQADYTKKHIESVYALMFGEGGKGVDLPYSVRAERAGDKISFFKKEKEEIITEENADEIPFSVGVHRFGDYIVKIGKEKEIGSLQFDISKIPRRAVIRTRLEGDKFKKFGGGTKSLGDFMTDRKIPKAMREKLPVVAVDEKILIVCGVEISEEVKVTERSSVYYIKIQNDKEN